MIAYTRPMKALFITALILAAVMLTACKSDPEVGTALKLSQQVSTQAFQQLSSAVTVTPWSHLMPENYVPKAQIFPWMLDNPFEAMQASLEETPVVTSLDGHQVKVSGYVVPLNTNEMAITEFLLVPFLGACIHVPPPPANQIVYVKPRYPIFFEESWGVISVMGTLSAEGRTSDFGAVGYEMHDALLLPFDEDEYAGVTTSPVVVDGDGASSIPLDTE